MYFLHTNRKWILCKKNECNFNTEEKVKKMERNTNLRVHGLTEIYFFLHCNKELATKSTQKW